jgi:putative PIG3 family NAD(P)H quinone oxidoreductase
VKAVLLDGFGGPEVLRIGEAEPPSVEPGRVLIRVAATSVNRPDISQRQGNYPPPAGESPILGLEAAGTIEHVGAGVSGFAPGERVMALLGGGGYAELAVAHASHVMKIPERMNFEQAACVCETYITAYLNVFMTGGLKDGDTVLLHGGGGGVNTAAIQLCRALTPAADVIVTASTGKVDRVAALGVDRVVDYCREDFADAVLRYTKKRGADVVLDHIGGPYLASNLGALAIGGRLALIGVMGGRTAEIDLGRLLVKRQQIIGSVLRPRPVEEKASIIARFNERVMPHFANGTIVPLIDRAYPLEQVAAAHAAMEDSAHFGKLVLRIGTGGNRDSSTHRHRAGEPGFS